MPQPKKRATGKSEVTDGETQEVDVPKAAAATVTKDAPLEDDVANQREEFEEGSESPSNGNGNGVVGPALGKDGYIHSDESVEDEEEEESEEDKKLREENEERQRKHREELDKIELLDEPHRWIVGKPPEMGGTPNEYSIYVQDVLPHMEMMKFYALVTQTITDAIKQGGVVNLGMSDVFSQDGGSLRDRYTKLTQQDFSDAGSFIALAGQLIAFSPNFLLDCYLIWLQVPRDDRGWARIVFQQRWEPEKGQYGLKDEQHDEIVMRFFDLNYEAARNFFAHRLPTIWKHIQAREYRRQKEQENQAAARKSNSDS